MRCVIPSARSKADAGLPLARKALKPRAIFLPSDRHHGRNHPHPAAPSCDGGGGGGRVKDPRGIEFQDPESIHVVGVYSSYDAAVDAWRAQAQRTVGRCRNENIVVVHIHKLLTPEE